MVKFRVKDVMTANIMSISPKMNAKDATLMLLNKGLSGLPVIDEAGKLVGVFTEREILKSILPTYLKNVGAFVYTEDPKSEIRKMASLDKFTVKDLMRQETPTLDEESSLAEASKIMATTGERRIIIMKDSKPVGIVTRYDIVKGLAKEAGIL